MAEELITPSIDASGLPQGYGLFLTFDQYYRHWYDAYGDWSSLKISLSADDGVTWNTESIFSDSLGSWTFPDHHALDISDYSSATLRVRFYYRGYGNSHWALDNVQINACWDIDGDAHYDVACNGNDCDDTDPDINPGMYEICDHKDNDCDGAIDEGLDADGDGFLPCSEPIPDCDDTDPFTYPGAEEICDGKDSDCDGAVPVDESDDDADDWIICEGDCDDSNPDAHPWAHEIPGNGVDDDCDGLIDEEQVILNVPADYATIQECIDAATHDDTCLVAPGTYFENIDFLGKDITLRSEGGPEVTYIELLMSWPIVQFKNGETVDAVLDGFTIRDGSSYDAGGIYCLRSSPTIQNCAIINNEGWGGYSEGGGIFCVGGSPSFINCMISNNFSHNGGGGLYIIGSSVTLVDCTISENSAEYNGSGIYAEDQSILVIENCRISSNSTVHGSGGGIRCLDSSLIITNSVISENSSDSGGGIYFSDGPLMIEGCTIMGNTAKDYTGGGIKIRDSDDASIRKCTISGNIANSSGGGISCSLSTVIIEDCTIADNIATDHGGGGIGACCTSLVVRNNTIIENSNYDGGAVDISNSSLAMTYCTISGNNSIWGPGGILFGTDSNGTITNSILWGNSGPEIQVNSGSPEVSHSDVQGGWPGTGNIDEDPLFVGGGDYHLTADSPCIDTGTDAEVYTDIDGDVRPQGEGFDMGSDEYMFDCWDLDDDGYADLLCGGDDCDDSDPDVNPEACEHRTAGTCDDGIDNDCDGLIDTDPECSITCFLGMVL